MPSQSRYCRISAGKTSINYYINKLNISYDSVSPVGFLKAWQILSLASHPASILNTLYVVVLVRGWPGVSIVSVDPVLSPPDGCRVEECGDSRCSLASLLLPHLVDEGVEVFLQWLRLRFVHGTSWNWTEIISILLSRNSHDLRDITLLNIATLLSFQTHLTPIWCYHGEQRCNTHTKCNPLTTGPTRNCGFYITISWLDFK